MNVYIKKYFFHWSQIRRKKTVNSLQESGKHYIFAPLLKKSSKNANSNSISINASLAQSVRATDC
jgi:hypothetical protein